MVPFIYFYIALDQILQGVAPKGVDWGPPHFFEDWFLNSSKCDEKGLEGVSFPSQGSVLISTRLNFNDKSNF